MEKSRIILLASIVALLTACNSETSTPAPPASDSAPAKDQVARVNETPVKAPSNPSDSGSAPQAGKAPASSEQVNDSTIILAIRDDNTAVVHGRLGEKGPNINCNFSIDGPMKLYARIIPDKSGCNVRINQIVGPGEKSDGPFGTEMHYSLPAKGSYHLVVGHNMMAGSPQVCQFSLQIKLTK